MSIKKKILKNRWLLIVLHYITFVYIRFTFATTRWQWVNAEILPARNNCNKPALYAFWHGRLGVMPCIFPRNIPIAVVISHHSDGEFIARVMRLFKFLLVRGSTRKGGTEALRGILSSLKEGNNIAITPDGPRGPRMRVNSNITAIAKMAGCPIIPVTYAIKNCKIFPSWDRFMLPLPFSKGIISFGKPIVIPPKSDKETLERERLALEEVLTQLTHEADLAMGLSPVMPADPS